MKAPANGANKDSASSPESTPDLDQAAQPSQAQTRIIFNGATCHTSARSSAEFLLGVSGDESDVWIVNGFATKEPVALHEGDELFCIPRGVLPPEQALDSMMRARHTPKLHEKLKRARVAVCGLGGLGSHIAIMLARSGVGELLLIDFDIIEPSNLNRQAYEISDLGERKTTALQRHIARINPYTQTRILNLRIQEQHIAEIFADMHIVCEAFDNAFAKAMLAQNFHTHHPDKILICASGLAGYGESNAIETKQITPHFYICGDGRSAAQVGRGLMAPRVNICAAHQANLVLELIASNECKSGASISR